MKQLNKALNHCEHKNLVKKGANPHSSDTVQRKRTFNPKDLNEYKNSN